MAFPLGANPMSQIEKTVQRAKNYIGKLNEQINQSITLDRAAAMLMEAEMALSALGVIYDSLYDVCEMTEVINRRPRRPIRRPHREVPSHLPR